MRKIFLISDQHYGHANILKFTRADGTLLRPSFANIDEMDERLIENHNSVVGDQDLVYFGGDICLDIKKFDNIMRRLKGSKQLILGNHDKFDMGVYQKWFQKITCIRNFKDERDEKFPFILSHYPLHPSTFSYNPSTKNVHGHTHYINQVDNNGQKDCRYVNICVEKINYTPVEICDLDQLI